METKIKKFLKFNGKAIYFVAYDGTYWIAIRPICEALNIEYTNEFKKIKRHKILGRNVAKMAMMDAQNRLFQMASLPEKYIYGWLFTVNSEKATFLEFQQKCYDVLYEYFHGTITRRHQALMNKLDTLAEIEQLEVELSTDPIFQSWNDARAKIMRLGKVLKNIDDEFVHGQKVIDFKQSN